MKIIKPEKGDVGDLGLVHLKSLFLLLKKVEKKTKI